MCLTETGAKEYIYIFLIWKKVYQMYGNANDPLEKNNQWYWREHI